jgi:hypothetical protein
MVIFNSKLLVYQRVVLKPMVLGILHDLRNPPNCFWDGFSLFSLFTIIFGKLVLRSLEFIYIGVNGPIFDTMNNYCFL